MLNKENTLNVDVDFWNDSEGQVLSNEIYHQLLIEQYKVYAEMADRAAARRVLTNVFFLTLHTTLLGLLGLSLSHQPSVKSVSLLFITLLGAILMCYVWWRLARYYRHLSMAKQVIINELEKRLPSRALGLGESKILSGDKPYNPLRRLELHFPAIFALLYVFCFTYVSHFSGGF